MSRPLVSLAPLGDAEAFQDALFNAQEQTLRVLLEAWPAVSLEPLAEVLDRRVSELRIKVVTISERTPVFWPPGLRLPTATAHPAPQAPVPVVAPKAPAAAAKPPPAPEGHPQAISEAQAVEIAYGDEIEQVASFLRAGLSAMVICDKLVVRHLWPRIVAAARLDRVVLELPPEDAEAGIVPRGLRQMQIARLRELIFGLKEGQVLVLPHLDLLVAATERGMSSEAREITELLYEAPDRPLLAFVDRSLVVPEVVAARFSVRISLSGLPREVPWEGRRAPVGVALVTHKERAMFADYTPAEFFKQVAGLNPIRLRDAMAYAVQIEARRGHGPDNPSRVARLYESIRMFKAQTSEDFVIPDVSMADIGGYEDEKALLARAIKLLAGVFQLPDDKLRRELIPRGFLFHGPPGTGKTLFAKAIANQMNATIRVVSGPEVTDMYVGESERKLRAIFAEARRNAPSVVVFDEFDSIAAKRSGRDDGGSRAGNALVAQILTEMDGFRPDVPMLVIGTTNRLNLIDEALLRPSRFQPIAIGLPDEAARRRIAEVHAKHFQIEASPALLDVIAEATHGMNGDQIRSIFRDACVGLFCETPPIEPTAERLGFLVGRIRAAADEQRLEGAAPIVAVAARAPSGPGPRRPSGALFTLASGNGPGGHGTSGGGST
ncbi:AAA family ATPase [Polyangium sorediatum]|uniref:ATP-binding protein n=1 Tax=Polyangium sorediatum TaxID=889274 RepID=A0ABT6NN64_9BACT|nr:ATP-binding protein [Polyangium sorediatum]MDI1429647.1 ATP-binding protein [Polyangium sorediatum]